MSNYIKQTKHPDTGNWGNAEWLDDYFGHHHYGVRFPDGSVFDPEKVKLKTRDTPPSQPDNNKTLGDNANQGATSSIIADTKLAGAVDNLAIYLTAFAFQNDPKIIHDEIVHKITDLITSARSDWVKEVENQADTQDAVDTKSPHTTKPISCVVYRTQAKGLKPDFEQANYNEPDQVQFEACVFSDGRCAQRWLTETGSMVWWNSWEDLCKVHIYAHPDYGTRVEWSNGKVDEL